jgi:hypothetical protein
MIWILARAFRYIQIVDSYSNLIYTMKALQYEERKESVVFSYRISMDDLDTGEGF